MTRETCPTTKELSDFVLGKLSDETLQPLTDHASDCADCQWELQAHDAAADDLIQQIRRPRRADATEAEPAMTRVLLEAESLAPASAPAATKPELPAHPWLAPAQAPDELGRLGSYRVLRLVGVGGMGMVYEGEDPQLRRRIALKVMDPAKAADDGPRRRFLHEARAMAALTHDHIIPIYQVGEERGVLFLAMPYLEGETLESRLKDVSPVSGRAPLPLTEALRIGREIAEGLDAAHARGLIHRDVKPSNIWLEAGRDRVKILDFGLARALESDVHLTQTGSIVGTPEFMAPEQAFGKPVDARSDLFSLGSVLYLLCTGVSPFKRAGEFDMMLAVTEDAPPSPRTLNPNLPAAAADLILNLLAKDPEQRPPTARAVADALEALRDQPKRPASRAPLVWIAAAVAVTVAAVVLAIPIVPGLLNGSKKPDIPNTETVEKDPDATPPDSAPPGLPAGPVGEAFCKAVAGLPPRKQVAAVAAKMKELNPNFDAIIRHPNIVDPPTPVWSIAFNTDEVTNISPVRALPALIGLHCTGSAPGKGRLADLSPLRGTKVARLDITNNPVRDLSPLRELPLEYFWFDDRPDQDPTPLHEIRTLLRIDKKPVAEFWAEHPLKNKVK